MKTHYSIHLSFQKSRLTLALAVGAALLLNVVVEESAFGVAAEIPTAGLATASFAVGVIGTGGAIVGNGGGAGNRFFVGILSIGTCVLDPDPATYYQGKIVISYPSSLMTVTGVGWFGNFATNSALPVLPLSTNGFEDTGGVGYNLLQGPNPAMDASLEATNGIVTLSFDAPDGIPGPDAPFNFANIQFQNTSGHFLEWDLVPSGNSANFYENPAQQVMTCTPDSTYPSPVTVASEGTPFQYQITQLPDPVLSTPALGVLELQGTVGLYYQFETSPDLVNWSPYQSTFQLESSPYFASFTTNGAPQEYFRVISWASQPVATSAVRAPRK